MRLDVHVPVAHVGVEALADRAAGVSALHSGEVATAADAALLRAPWPAHRTGPESGLLTGRAGGHEPDRRDPDETFGVGGDRTQFSRARAH
ncbi:hypothetical protein [Micromonospora peucetia]|uniref:hypothetical protein n=1 Tax=Micromonospora peucetia TaxID=47871 RepID=UPI00114CBD4B|nr:hypothetical protein [Micromonospora peucetia]